MTYSARKYLLLMVLTALITASCSEGSHTKAEALYLLEALRQVLAFEEGKLPKDHPLLYRMKQYPDEKYALPLGQSYVWFTMRPESIRVMQKAEVSTRDAGHSFYGFFLVIDNEQRILDFGWHKP